MSSYSKKKTYSDDKPEPIASYGVINITILDPLNYYTELIREAFSSNDIEINIENIVCVDNDEFNALYDMVSESLLFLLVSRRHSLGFVEFIRGKYNADDYDDIYNLFIQMTDNEIKEIFSNDFDYLWNSMWKKNAKKTTYYKEYTVAKEKYTLVIGKYSGDLFKPTYPIREWGFPKGRKNNNESNITCAIRECCEETSLFKSEISILPSIAPMTEVMTGTNNISYKHVYYLSLVNETRPLDMYHDNLHFIEIDTAGWFKKERVNNLLRPYHIEKFYIIDKIVNFITYSIYCAKNYGSAKKITSNKN